MLANDDGVAEPAPRLAVGLSFGHAASHELSGTFVEVESQLLVELVLDARRAEDVEDARETGHGVSPSKLVSGRSRAQNT